MPENPAEDHSRLQANLRYLLNQWDPLGIADLYPNEYDCILVPLWNLLLRAPTRAEVSEFLWYELQDHLRLDPVDRGVDTMADRLVAWAATVLPPP
jgi:hypothetical protein